MATRTRPRSRPTPPPPDEAPASPKRRSLADIEEQVNILFYGDAGTGKTTDIAHLAKMGRVLIVNAEGGIKRRPLEKEFKLPIDNIEVFPDPGERVTFESLDQLFWEVKGRLEDDPNDLVGVCWDSITEIHKVLLEHVRERGVEKIRRKLRSSGQDTSEVDPFFVDLSYYGTMTEQMRLLIRRFRDLPCHVGFTALPRKDQDDDTGAMSYGPAVTPALQQDLLGYMDVICLTTTEELDDDEDLFIGTFIRRGIRQAKDRFHALPKRMADPTFDRVIAYVNGDLEADTDPLQAKAREQMARKAEARKARKGRKQASAEDTNEDEGEEEDESQTQ